MVVYVTENASNAVKSAKDFEIDSANHQRCVAHTLNLIVQKYIRWKNDEEGESNDSEISIKLRAISDTIECIQEYAKYFNRSTIGSNWLKKSMKKSDKLSVMIPLDVITRWNSTYSMIKTGVEIRLHLDGFASYIQTSEGHSEFSSCHDFFQISSKQ
jgi:hypothetical protein